MMANMFVASIKVGGKVLREVGEVVMLPFGSEFSIYLKNLNSRRALVKVSIDGTDVLNGSELVVNGNSVLELERYLKDLNKGNRFKFIERTDSVEQHRGISAEDGLVRIEFAYEKQYAPIINRNYLGPNYLPPRWYEPPSPQWYGTTVCDSNIGAATMRSAEPREIKCSSALHNVSSSAGVSFNAAPQNDVGITVPGSVSDQSFAAVAGFQTDPSTVIVLRLLGKVGHGNIIEPITVKAKQKCVTCGLVNKLTSKFCSNCGTSLQLV